MGKREAAEKDYGGIGRLRYFLGVLGLAAIAIGVFLYTMGRDEPALLAWGNAAIIGSLAVLVVYRWRNVGWSGWWLMLMLVPLANLVLLMMCFACPAGYRYSKGLDTTGKVVLVGIVGLVFLWFAAALLLDWYAGLHGKAVKHTNGDSLYAPASATEPPRTFRRYTSEQDGFSVLLPGKPEVRVYGIVRDYAVLIEKEAAYNVFVSIFAEPVLPEEAIRGALKRYVEARLETSRAVGEAVLLHCEEGTFGDRLALKYEYVCDRGDLTLFHGGVCLVRGGRLYAICVVCPAGTKASAFRKHATMVESFRLTKLQNPKPLTGVEGFLNAVRAGNQVAVQEALRSSAHWVHAKDKAGMTPLHIAASEGRKAMARLLIGKGAEPNATNSWKDTPLHVAADMGSQDVVELLIEEGADVNAKNKAGYTPLHRAAQSLVEGGNPQVVALLVKHGADVNAKSKWGLTPLHFAARRGHIAVARLLVDKGADVNAKSRLGTPLDAALQYGHEDLAALLKQHGAR